MIKIFLNLHFTRQWILSWRANYRYC